MNKNLILPLDSLIEILSTVFCQITNDLIIEKWLNNKTITNKLELAPGLNCNMYGSINSNWIIHTVSQSVSQLVSFRFVNSVHQSYTGVLSLVLEWIAVSSAASDVCNIIIVIMVGIVGYWYRFLDKLLFQMARLLFIIIVFEMNR